MCKIYRFEIPFLTVYLVKKCFRIFVCIALPHYIQYYFCRYYIHASGFTKPNGNEIGEHNIPNGYIIDHVFTVNTVALPVPFWVIAAVRNSDYCLFTKSEFETTSTIKVCYMHILKEN